MSSSGPVAARPGRAIRSLALRAAQVCSNRSHPRPALALLWLLARGGSDLGRARAGVLAARLRLEMGEDGAASSWRGPVERLLRAVDTATHGGPVPGAPARDDTAAAGGAGAVSESRPVQVRQEMVDGAFEALALAFHPLIHQGLAPSPVVSDPDGFAAVLDGHPCVDLMRATAPTARADAGGSPGRSGRALRVLVVTDTNLAFMGDLLDHWRDRSDVEVRVRDLRTEDVDPSWWSLRATVADRLGGHHPAAPPFLADDIAWADTVWSEWGGALTARLSGCVLRARLVVRLHRYEAFTMMPQVTDWDRVDDLVVVSPAVREALVRVVPGVGTRTRIHVVANVVDLRRFDLPKDAGAARTLALVGWDRPVKDPDWALDLLEELRRRDRSWRLLLVGAPPGRASDSPTRAWSQAMEHRVTRLGGAVERTGQRSDLPEVLRRAGVIVSSSRVESAHLALQQGVASGCLPVVRDWPDIADLGGARDLYPGDWVVDTPAEGADRVVATAEGAAPAAQAWTLEHLDGRVVAPLLDRLLLEADP